MNNNQVLYIDDEIDLLDIAVGFFEDENLSIDTCSDFHDALNLIRKKKYDVVISDANMPTGTGAQLYDTIKNEFGFKGKFILVTGDLVNIKKNNLTYDEIFFKPLDFRDLVLKVKSWLNHSTQG